METKEAKINLGNNIFAIVDLEDLPKLSVNRWFAQKRKNGYYAASNTTIDGKGKKIYMHHVILGNPVDGKEVDHINGDGLDNRKENLRTCTHRQNIQASRKRNCKASSKYKGVYWETSRKKWRTRITRSDGKKVFLGYFDSELDAANAYDKAATEMFGSFATLNFPKPPEDADRLFPE